MSNEIQEITDDNFTSEVFDKKGVVVVDFYADWCAPCKLLSNTMKELSEEYDENTVKILKANVEENSSVVSKFGIIGVPAILFFKNGELINKQIGLRSKKDLKKDIEVVCHG